MNTVSYTTDADETEPVEAIVLHRAGGRVVGVHHRIVADIDGRPVLDAGALLSHEGARDFSQRLSGGGGRLILPPRVVVADSDLLVWWSPAQRRPIFFRTPDRDWNRRMDRRRALHPALLFAARPGRNSPTDLSVFALAESARPGPGTALLRAPYLNLYATGFMCDGDVPMPPVLPPTAETLDGFERGFYDSSFAHSPMGGAQLVRWPRGHDGFWESMAASDHGFFPAHALVPLNSGGSPLTLERMVSYDAHQLPIDPE